MESILIGIGNNIILRRFAPSDAPVIFELIDRNREYLKDEGISQKYPTLESVLNSIASPVNGRKLRFGIWDLGAPGTFKKEVLVGSINTTPHENRWAEIGYWISKDCQNKKYIKRSAKKLVSLIFKRGDTDFIIADVRKENKYRDKSVAILKKLGLQEIAESEEQLFFCLERWPIFNLDAMASHYGVIHNRAEWEEVVKKVFRGDTERLKKMKSNNLAPIGIPDFGEGIKYGGSLTLGRWFEENQIDPEI